MHRTPLSWVAALAVLSCLSVDSHAWILGRTATLPRPRLSIFPRKYRQLDHDEERANPKLRTFWRSSSTPLVSKDSTLSVTSPLKEPFQANKRPATGTQLDESSVVESAPKIEKPLTSSLKKAFKANKLTANKQLDDSLPATESSKSKKRPVANVQELRTAVLDDGLELRQTQLVHETATLDVKELLNHDVIRLIAERAKSGSTPGRRQDNATLALSMEGGGMRGAVSAGMAAAIASLGLSDVFDSIYGSSAGSVVGAYMVSRQMCVDVYTQVLPAATTKFVCKKRMMAGLMASAVDLMLGSVYASSKLGTPGMNISFVLDGIMDHEHGLRPLDMKAFRENDKVQPLRIATSCVQDGKLSMKCLGTKDFFDHVDPITNQTVSATVRIDGRRKGLYACLEAGMTVPGATGPPVKLTDGNGVTTPCFDAFCFEPLPYRSAVEDGATHVLVLRSRPECFQAKTSPGVYEKGVAPLYFRSHGEEEVARFFDKGGQQYIYLEDLLTLEEGRQEGLKHIGGDGIHVPPTTILYGVDQDEGVKHLAANRNLWKKAHLLPITVPKGTPELSTLEQGQDEVLEAVRGGFAAAFDLLAPAAGLELESGMTGERVAKLVFPKQAIESLDSILGQQVSVPGHLIEASAKEPPSRRLKRKRLAIKNLGRRLAKPFRRKSEPPMPDLLLDSATESSERCHREDAQALLGLLPGIQNGNLPPISEGLHYCRAIDTLL